MRRVKVALLVSVSWNAPVGCSGNASQKPICSAPAATLSRYVLSGLVIQNIDTVLSEGIRTSLDCWLTPPAGRVSPDAARLVPMQGLDVWHLVRIPRLCTNSLPCSTPSSRKKQWPTEL